MWCKYSVLEWAVVVVNWIGGLWWRLAFPACTGLGNPRKTTTAAADRQYTIPAAGSKQKKHQHHHDVLGTCFSKRQRKQDCSRQDSVWPSLWASPMANVQCPISECSLSSVSPMSIQQAAFAKGVVAAKTVCSQESTEDTEPAAGNRPDGCQVLSTFSSRTGCI